MKKRKILFLITKSNWGGAQRYVYDLATNLPDNFEPVTALGGDGVLIEKLKSAGVRVIPIPGLQRDVSLWREVVSFYHIAMTIRAEDPDILHINSSKAGAIGVFLGRLLLVPRVIFTAHGWAFNEERPYISRLIIKFIHWLTVLFSHTTIAVSNMTKSQLNWPGAQSKMTIVHNGRTVTGMFDRPAARSKIIEILPILEKYKEDFWSVTIAELHPVKQHNITIKAMTEIAQKFPEARHVIIGDGEERQNLAALVYQNKLQNNVFFTGGVPEAARFLPAFDLFVLSSRSEAMAYVIIEACAAGLPIISSRVGGIAEIIDDNVHSMLYESGDIPTLVDKYQKMFTDEELRKKYRIAARERSSRFSLGAMVQKTIVTYGR